MAKLRALAVIVLAIALSGAAYSAPGRGGGGGYRDGHRGGSQDEGNLRPGPVTEAGLGRRPG